MTTFLLDLWQDLRAKRLWPVAAALLLATVAVPVVLSKPTSSAPPTAAAPADRSEKLPTVALDASSVTDSHLNVFDQKNPFRVRSDKLPGIGDVAGANGAVPIGKSVASAVTSANKSASAAGGGSSTSVSGGSSTTTTTGPDGKPVTPGLHYFSYTADVRFGKRGKVKTYKSLKVLDVLPDGQNPIVSFMGVKNNGHVAVFFIADPAFKADGEGKCQPSRESCRFLYMKTDDSQNEATLSAQNGQIEYTLELTGLHVKSLSESEAVGDTTPDKSTTTGSKHKAAKRRATLLSISAAAFAKR